MKNPKHILRGGLSLLLTAVSFSLFAQFPVNNVCTPTSTKAIRGVDQFERKKYINLAASTGEVNSKLGTGEQAQRYVNELEMTVGRSLSMVYAETNWGKSLFEDPDREGYVDIERMKAKFESTSSTDRTDYPFYATAYGSNNQDLAVHDRAPSYPSFMEQYSVTSSGTTSEEFPVNTKAAGELAANVLKYRYNDFNRPKYYEIVNEPKWTVWSDSRFTSLHTDVKKEVDALGLDINVGGPCYAVSNFYQNNYQNLSHMTDFIDNTNFELDFYSFHTYDYITWNTRSGVFEGSINSGIPLEGVLDALASYTYNEYGRELHYVASEHGGYLPDEDNRTTALDFYGKYYFPGEGFDFEMEKRSIDNFIMVNSAIANAFTFINHPHVVLKSVPFILLESASWDTYYYSSLLVKEDFDKNSANYVECKLIYFYDYFKDVKGRRVNSYCDATDIQHFALVNDNTLMLMYHNQSNSTGEINLNINGMSEAPSSITVRKLGANAIDKRPYFTEEAAATDLSSLYIEGQESVAIFVTYPNPIAESEYMDEIPHYATEQGVEFTGSKTFSLDIDNFDTLKDAFLRVGIHRENGSNSGINITVNGNTYETSTEKAASRLTSSEDGYVTQRVIQIPLSQLHAEDNEIKVQFTDGGQGGVGAVVLRGVHSAIRKQDTVTVKLGGN